MSLWLYFQMDIPDFKSFLDNLIMTVGGMRIPIIKISKARCPGIVRVRAKSPVHVYSLIEDEAL